MNHVPEGHNYEFFNSSGPLNGFKRSLHEGGHRSPLIVRWPQKIAPGVRDTTQQWAFYDFMATAADLGGLQVCLLKTEVFSFDAVLHAWPFPVCHRDSQYNFALLIPVGSC